MKLFIKQEEYQTEENNTKNDINRSNKKNDILIKKITENI